MKGLGVAPGPLWLKAGCPCGPTSSTGVGVARRHPLAFQPTTPPRLLLPALRQVPRISPQHPLQLLGREPASQQSPHVHLGALDERLTEALVQAGAAPLIGSGDMPLWIAHDDEGSA